MTFKYLKGLESFILLMTQQQRTEMSVFYFHMEAFLMGICMGKNPFVGICMGKEMYSTDYWGNQMHCSLCNVVFNIENCCYFHPNWKLGSDSQLSQVIKICLHFIQARASKWAIWSLKMNNSAGTINWPN